MEGITWLFWGIGIALPTWYWIHRRWMGAHLRDQALNKRHIPTYVAPTLNCKTIERF